MAKPTPPPDETKADKFIRVAERRMTTAMESLRNLENLSETTTYEYSRDQTGKMLSTLRGQLDKVEECFKLGGKVKVESGFSF